MDELKNLLVAIQKVYPGDSFMITFGLLSIKFRRMDSYNDGLSSFYRYRGQDNEKQIIYGLQDEAEVIHWLNTNGIDDAEIMRKLEAIAIEGLIVLDAKNNYSTDLLSEDLHERARIRKEKLVAEFERIKHDPAQLAKFVIGLAAGETPEPTPKLTVVESADD